MKLVSYSLPENPEIAKLGVMLNDEEFVGIEQIASVSDAPELQKLTDIHSLIEAGPQVWEAVFKVARQLPGSGIEVRRLDSVSLLPSVPRPSKVCCLALNNSANADRIMSGPKHPALFTKPSTALLGHGQAIQLRKHYGRVHPEPELALVIGKRARNISADEAYDYVFGYTVHNDLTSPTMRGEDTFHYRAIHPAAEGEGIQYVDSHVSYSGRYKGTDNFSPLGPWIVTKDEIADPHNLNIECHVRDELFASDNTVNLFHKVPQVLEFISSYMTLLPGDVVSLGTALASGGKPGRAVQNADLNLMGGPVSVTIEGIGRLTNTVEHAG